MTESRSLIRQVARKYRPTGRLAQMQAHERGQAHACGRALGRAAPHPKAAHEDAKRDPESGKGSELF